MTLKQVDESILESFRRTLRMEDLDIFIGDATPDPRPDLRKQLVEVLEVKKIPHNSQQMLDLNQIPRLSKGDVSLSHCPKFQGLMISQKDGCIGFDIEDPDRVTSELALRVSDEEQLQRAPNPAILWVAKEAAFKALSKSHGARLLSEISLNQWIPLTEGFFAIKATFGKHSAVGAACMLSNCFYSGFKS